VDMCGHVSRSFGKAKSPAKKGLSSHSYHQRRWVEKVCGERSGHALKCVTGNLSDHSAI
jgi:hypothetical protein